MKKRLRWPWLARRVFVLLAALVSLYLLLPSLISVFASWRSLTTLNWAWVGLALLGEIASFVSLWELDRIALRTPGWFAVACAQLSGNAIGRILPGGGATSSAFAIGMLRRAGIEARRAAAALAASTALQIAMTLALPLLAFPAIAGGAPINHGLVTAAYLGIVVLVLLLAAGGLAFATDRPLVLVACAIASVLNRTIRRRRPVSNLAQQLLRERDGIRRTISARLKTAIASAAGNIGFDFLALLCVLRAVGAEPRPALIVLAYTTAALLSLIPFTPGGLGFVEAGLVGTLTLAGVSTSHAVVATLAYRLISFWLPVPVGGGAYLLFRHRYR